MKKNYSPLYYKKMRRADIDEFVDGLHQMQLNMIDEAVEKTNYEQAKEILQYIMEKK